MYQLANDFAPVGAVDSGRLFLESCSATPVTDTTLALVHSAATMMHSALENGNLTPLCDFAGTVMHRGYEIADVLAAAGQLVIDSIEDTSASRLENTMRRIATLQRDVLPVDYFSAEGFGSLAFAG